MKCISLQFSGDAELMPAIDYRTLASGLNSSMGRHFASSLINWISEQDPRFAPIVENALNESMPDGLLPDGDPGIYCLYQAFKAIECCTTPSFFRFAGHLNAAAFLACHLSDARYFGLMELDAWDGNGLLLLKDPVVRQRISQVLSLIETNAGKSFASPREYAGVADRAYHYLGQIQRMIFKWAGGSRRAQYNNLRELVLEFSRVNRQTGRPICPADEIRDMLNALDRGEEMDLLQMLTRAWVDAHTQDPFLQWGGLPYIDGCQGWLLSGAYCMRKGRTASCCDFRYRNNRYQISCAGPAEEDPCCDGLDENEGIEQIETAFVSGVNILMRSCRPIAF